MLTLHGKEVKRRGGTLGSWGQTACGPWLCFWAWQGRTVHLRGKAQQGVGSQAQPQCSLLLVIGPAPSISPPKNLLNCVTIIQCIKPWMMSEAMIQSLPVVKGQAFNMSIFLPLLFLKSTSYSYLKTYFSLILFQW